VTVCCRALPCVTVRCSVLQCVAACCSVLHYCVLQQVESKVCDGVLPCVAVRYSAVQHAAVRCSVLQRVAVYCITTCLESTFSSLLRAMDVFEGRKRCASQNATKNCNSKSATCCNTLQHAATHCHLAIYNSYSDDL